MTNISELPPPASALSGAERFPALKGAGNAGVPLFAAFAGIPRGSVLALAKPFLADTASIADSDPGAGNIRWNHATQASATVLYIDNVDTAAADISAALAALTVGGFLWLQAPGPVNKDVWQKWQVASITDASGYTKVGVTWVDGAGAFADDGDILLSVQQPDPVGLGDVVGPAAATDGHAAVFDGGSGKLLKDGGAVSNVRGKHAVPIMAGSMSPKQAAGCAALAYFTGASGQPDVAYLAFDPSTEEHAQFAIPAPKSWNEGTVTFVPRWMHPATTTNFGVCWKLRALAVSNDDTVVASFGTAQSSVDTGGTTSDHYAGPESSAITIAGSPAAQDLILLDIYRDPTDAGDTMAVDAWLIGVDVFLTTDADTDA